jgi:hypothetical protein
MSGTPPGTKRISGEAIGGWATAAALIVSIVTFLYTYNSQEKFNKAQIQAVNEGLKLQATSTAQQEKSNEEQRKAAEAQRETAAVEALGRYLEKPTDAMAWETAETIIDVMGKDADPAWKATAKRAVYSHPGTLKTLECELYSEAFKDFVVSLTVTHNRDELCAREARFAPLHHGAQALPRIGDH